MANIERVAGVNSYLLYGAETTFGTAATPNKQFGYINNFRQSINRNSKALFGLATTATDGATAKKLVSLQLDTNPSIDFVPVTWGFMEYVLGAVSGAGILANPYVYTIGDVKALTLSNNIDNATTDREELYLGCVVNNFSCEANINEEVKANIDFVGGKFSKDSTLTSITGAPTGDVYVFQNASLAIAGVTQTNLINRIRISINNNAELRRGMNRDAQNGFAKNRNIGIEFDFDYKDEALLEWVMGGSSMADLSETATLTVTFSVSANRNIVFTFSGVMPSEKNRDDRTGETITGSISVIAKSVSVSEIQSET